MNKYTFFLISIFSFFSFCLQSQETSETYFDAGNKLLGKKKYTECIEMYNKAIDISPLEPEYYVYRGLAKYYLQDYQAAITDFTRTIEIQPDYAEAYNLRGIARGDIGDKTGACEDWYKASDLGLNSVIKLIQEFCLED